MNDFQEFKERLKSVFHDVSDIENRVDCPYTIETHISSPPSYMVRWALQFIGEFHYCGATDKIEWIICLKYKDINFEIRDWKRETWTIQSDNETPEAKIAAQDLKKKIILVASQLDKVLSDALKQDVTEGKFFLNNPYPKIRSAYEWFRQKAGTSTEVSPVKESTDLHKILSERFTKETERSLQGYAMVGFYYSSLDSLFNVFYALGNRSFDVDMEDLPLGERFYRFRRQSWRERFKAVMPVGQRPELNRIYDKLLRLKMNLRDELFHGFDGDENLLVFFEGVGLIPISYEALSRSIHFTPLFADTPFIDKAIQTFDEFDSWLQNNSPWSFYIQYAKSSLVIPFYGERLEELKQAIASGSTAFKKWLDNKVEYLDY